MLAAHFRARFKMAEAYDEYLDDDLLELEPALEERAGGRHDGAAALSAGPAGKGSMAALRKKIDRSAVNRSQALPFLASVQLDMGRPSSIGLRGLFLAWLEHGRRTWLNPCEGLRQLEEILLKYQGNEAILAPFVELLRVLAEEEISPASFVSYVMLPRMRRDYDWRKWQENHLDALWKIAGVIVSAKNDPPFNREHLETSRIRLSRDVVLVRYIGCPLAQYPLARLNDAEALANYTRAWQNISLANSLSVYFMRQNVLHFIYAMSGRIDLVQLTALIGQLPEIESAFASAFPQGAGQEKIDGVHLFEYDITTALQARRQRGYRSFDFTAEVRAYLNIVKTLLEKTAGVYLCAYYARLLRRYKDPVLAGAVARLVETIDDLGGMHIYRWHTKKLLGKPKNELDTYVDFIRDHQGCDPEYPPIRVLFRDEDAALETGDVLGDAEAFGLGRHFAKADAAGISYRELLKAYTLEHPETEALIRDYQEQLLEGRDRLWNGEYTEKLDSLDDRRHKNMHRTLLRSVIRGIGSGLSVSGKSSGFAQLFADYGAVQRQSMPAARNQFTMPVKPVGRSSPEREAMTREKINNALIGKIWRALSGDEPAGENRTLAYINTWAMEIKEPYEKAFEKKAVLEKSLQTEALDEESVKKLKREIAGKDKTMTTLQNKKEQYEIMMETFTSLNDEQKFICALVLAGALGRNDETFAAHVTGLLLQRYRGEQRVSSRLEFLKEDIGGEFLTYTQLTYFLNFLETLFFLLREDRKITAAIEKDTTLPEILRPYLITKKKNITGDALDAAAKKMTEYAALQSERAKWQGLLQKMEEKDDAYFHTFEIYSSKSFIDSYYGDMGGTCLSSQPRYILNPGFFVLRLADLTDKEIVGMSIMYLSDRGFSSPQVQARYFWQAFAFNPLHSVLRHCTLEQQLYIYLQYRLAMENLAWALKIPVVISGIANYCYGLISNNSGFCELIRRYELRKPTAKKVTARGLSVYYSERVFAEALMIIDPRGYEQAEDPSSIPSFYAHRQLSRRWW
jgi:hypothetical protein